jgi:hypothetical protein
MDQSNGPDSGQIARHAYDAIGIAIGVGLTVAALPVQWSWAVRILAGLLVAVVLVTLFSYFPAIPARILAAFRNPRFALPVIGVVAIALAWVAISPSISIPSIAPATWQYLWQAVIPGAVVVLYELVSRARELAQSPAWVIVTTIVLGIGVSVFSFSWLHYSSLSPSRYPPFPPGGVPLWVSVAAVGTVALLRALLNLIPEPLKSAEHSSP